MSAANRNDVSQLLELLDRIAPCEDAAPAPATQPAELATTTAAHLLPDLPAQAGDVIQLAPLREGSGLNTITHVVPLGKLSPLRYARLARGLTQRELEQHAGLSETTVSHFDRLPDPATQWRLAAALGVDVDVLFPCFTQ